ncbi:GreA/GreB family elongation factor [Anaeromyxobacter oryzisoli]|uniref:GreA/GreB family elongation factor n=1 Tax=Anaeromyxobacter oryzisoli TaxID=2925408 RepID=UPI001F589BDE|nr:GreA/GreB family elongation factor [Anaeromyxobacter sp. SG63]
MSKAFTNEELPDVAPVTRAAPRLAPGEVRYVTPEGHAALRSELGRLAAARAEAAARPDADQGERLADLDRRAALLEATLAALTVLGPDAAPEGRVAFGTWVTVEDESGASSTWRIVGPDEADPKQGLVSARSPVGRALLGQAAGDIVEVERPGGTRTLTIVEVRRSR